MNGPKFKLIQIYTLHAKINLSISKLQTMWHVIKKIPWPYLKFPDFSLTFPGLQNSLTIPGFPGLWEPCTHQRGITVLSGTHTFIHKCNEPFCFYFPVQSITALWMVVISRPTEGRRLSWPGWLGVNTGVVYPPKDGHLSQH